MMIRKLKYFIGAFEVTVLAAFFGPLSDSGSAVRRKDDRQSVHDADF